MFKKKKIDPNQTIKSVNVGVFEIRISEVKIEINTSDRTWKQIYASNTRPFAELAQLLSKVEFAHMAKDEAEETRNGDLIHNICYALYGTTLFFYYPELCREWIQKYNDFSAGMKKAQEEQLNPEVPEPEIIVKKKRTKK